MRYFLFLFLPALFILPFYGTAQDYSLGNGFSDGDVISTCSGTFYDSKPTGNYSANEHYSVTFCPATIGKVIEVHFTTMTLGTGDTLFVYDGNSQNAHIVDTLFGGYTGDLPIIASDTNTTGCLTFRFKSDATIQAAGWQGDISCIYACNQKILGTITTTPARDLNGYTNFCLANGGVLLNAATTYPNNDIAYHQTDTTSRFHWFFGDGHDTAGIQLTSISHTYLQQGGYNAKLIITDMNGCLNSTPITDKLRTGIKPSAYNIAVPAASCAGDTVRLFPANSSSPGTGGFVAPGSGSFLTLPISSDSLFLPDLQNVSYVSHILIDQFAPGQTLTNINDLVGVFMTMEHSYLGDLEITLTAPNGATVKLKSYPGGGNCFLGEPVDGNLLTGGADNPALDNVVGNGYTYIFNNNPQHGTMIASSTLYTYSYIDNAGQHVVNHLYLPAGSYTPTTSLNALVGTPLNGTWTLTFLDHDPIDNGFLFGWHVEFNPSLFPSVETYTVPIVQQTWVTPATGLVNVNGTVATIVPPAGGNYNYKFKVVDTFGCVFDTTVILPVSAQPNKPNLGPDRTFCPGQAFIDIQVLNPDFSNYTWNNFTTGFDNPVSVPGTYIVTATNGAGCFSKDTIVVNPSYNITMTIGADTMFCATSPNILRPISNVVMTSYLWSNGTTADSLKLTGIGNYWVKGTDANNCIDTAFIKVTDNPVNHFKMPNDTIICEKSNYQLSLAAPAGSSIIWNDGTNGYTNTITGPNTYIAVANVIGCLHTDSFHVATKPLPVVSLGPDQIICQNISYTAKVSYPGANYLWSNNSTDSFLVIKTSGNYSVEAFLNGCTYSDDLTMTFVKCDCDTKIPSAFSPNGDGINETFKPDMQCVPGNYKMNIFNRSGQLIYETKNYQDAWDGRYNGKPLPIGTYYYIINYLNVGLQKPEQFSGSITILR